MTTLVPPPDVYARKSWRVTGGGEITSLGPPAPAGTMLPILFEDNATGRGLVAGSNLELEGDFRYTAGSSILLWSIGTAWKELTRSSPSTSKAFLSPYGAGTIGMHPGSSNPGELSTQAMLQNWVNNRVYAPVITITLAADPSTVAATIEIDTSAENGDTETFDVTASQDPTTEAADIVKQMTGQSPYTTTPDLVTARNVSTFFKVTSSGGTITLKPKLSYAAMRNVTMRIVSGSGIASWTNLDGAAVSTSSVAVAMMPMGGRVPIPTGLINGQADQDGPIILDVPGTILVGQPATLWEISENGGLIAEAEGCGLFGMNMLWPEEGSGNRNGKAAILVAASDFTARGNSITVDSLGAQASGLSCSAMASIQITASNPTHRSYSYLHHHILKNKLFLGNRVAPLTWNSTWDLNIQNNYVTSKFSRTNGFGDGALSATEAPLPATITNCDEIDWTNNRMMNSGGHSAGDESEAQLVVDRTGNGVDGTHEGGHIRITGGSFHGSATHYGAQILLRNLWFARIDNVAHHRHLLPQTNGFDYWKRGAVVVEDCVDVTVTNPQIFNLGTDGSDYDPYAAISLVATEKSSTFGGAGHPKTFKMRGGKYYNRIAGNQSGDTPPFINQHPLFAHFCTRNRDRWDMVDIQGVQAIAGGWAEFTFTILDNDLLAAGEGFEMQIPEDTFGSGSPPDDDPGAFAGRTITVDAGTYFSKSVPNGAIGTALNIAVALNADTNFSEFFEATVDESAYHSSLPSSATVTVRCKTHGGAANSVTLEHLGNSDGASELRVASGVIAEGASGTMEGGFGADNTDGGQPCISLVDVFGTLQTTYLNTSAPRAVNIKNNQLRGWRVGVEVVTTIDPLPSGGSGPSIDMQPDTINDWANENQFA
ncbi:MAG: hypothetical protein ACPGVG_05810 [Mycobacterium sp.]